MKGPGPRPSNPDDISFSEDCFACVGHETVYIVYNGTGFGYPQTWTNKMEAYREARIKNCDIVESTRRIMKRIKWK